MKKQIVVAACALAGCATTQASLKEGGPFLQMQTNKSLAEVSSCLSEQWAHRSGSTNMTPRPSGVTLTLSYVVYSSTVAAVSVDIDDTGSERSISVFARKGDRGDKLKGEVGACV